MSFAWSFTSLSQFRTCPKQYQEVRVLKTFRDEKNEHSIWGDRAHKAIEACLRDGTPLPEGMTVWQPLIDKFKKLKGELHVENQMAMRADFTPCEWFAPDTWCRAIIDALWIDGHIAKAVDWKTGKRKPNSDQLALFALHVFYHYPDVQEVRTMFVWLKTGDTDVEVFKREDIPKLWLLFMTDITRLENCMQNNVWVPRTSGLCSQWCPVVTCQFNGRRRQKTW